MFSGFQILSGFSVEQSSRFLRPSFYARFGGITGTCAEMDTVSQWYFGVRIWYLALIINPHTLLILVIASA